jgi:hypothetical protein
MFSLSLRLVPQTPQTADLRLVYVRGEAPRETLCFDAEIAGPEDVRRQTTDDTLKGLAGMIVVERGVKRSTEKGMLYLGFLNDASAFWGDDREPALRGSFQVYTYLPEEMFDRISDLAKAGKLPSVTIDIGDNQGFYGSQTAGSSTITWDNQQHPSVKLESVRVDFALSCSA